MEHTGTLTLAVSFPIPVLPPVTMTTLPVRSGMSSTVHFGLGIQKPWSMIARRSRTRRSARERGNHILVDERALGQVWLVISVTYSIWRCQPGWSRRTGMGLVGWCCNVKDLEDAGARIHQRTTSGMTQDIHKIQIFRLNTHIRNRSKITWASNQTNYNSSLPRHICTSPSALGYTRLKLSGLRVLAANVCEIYQISATAHKVGRTRNFTYPLYQDWWIDPEQTT